MRSSTGSIPASTETRSLLDAWADVKSVDHHCHPLWRWSRDVNALDLRAVFTEATAEDMLMRHVPATVVYQDALRRLARALGCAASEEAVLDARRRAGAAEHTRRLLEVSRTGTMLIDFGFADRDAFTREEHAGVVPAAQHEVVRLEQVGEQLIDAGDGPPSWFEAVRAELRARVGAGAIAVKSIASYRGGIRLRATDADEVGFLLRQLRAQRAQGAPLRLEGETLCHPLLREAAVECAALGIPLQVHCGLGDTDEDLAAASPLGLRPLLLDPGCRDLQLVLLHCYPYHREAAYLCAVHANVFMDLSLTLPLAGLDGARAMTETLGLCPWTKLLYGSDASRLAEYYLVAAAAHREALAFALAELVARDILTHEVAAAAGTAVLRDNARRLYRLDA